MDDKPNDGGSRGGKAGRSDGRSEGGGGTTSLHPGSLLAHTYEIVGMLARGGMGEVYRARHRYMGTEHAIKVILPELASDQRVVGLFQREAQVLRQLRHEAVVAYDGLFSDEFGRVYLAMEFVDGPSLKDALNGGAIAPDEVRMLRDRLASGLAAAHEAGVVHRDLSPDNVILPGGRLDQAKIIDFGIAKRTDPEKSTIIGSQFAGKYSFASPEQFGMYGGDIGPKSDIYSLGLILAAAASGKALPMGTSTIEVVEARRKVPDLTGVPADLRREIAPMLEPDPKDRPTSMRDLVGGGGRSGTRPPGRRTAPPPRRAARPSRGVARTLAVALITVLVLSAAAGGGVWLWQRMQGDEGDGGALLARIDAATTGIACGAVTGRAAADGTVTLTGRIGSAASRDTLIDRVAAIDGVSAVRSELSIVPCEDLPPADREAIRAAMARAVDGHACAELSFEVTEGGRVRLFGRVGSRADRDALQRTAAGIAGVVAVDNALAVHPCAEPVEPPGRRTVAAAVDRTIASVACGDVNATVTEDLQVHLSGWIGNQGQARALRSSIAAIDGVAGVTSDLSFDPCLPEGFSKEDLAAEIAEIADGLDCASAEARLTDDLRVVLSGHVESARDRRRLESRLRALEHVAAVEGDLSVVPWPQCEALALASAGGAGIAIAANNPDGVYREGERLVLEITVPDFDGFLYVDYFGAYQSVTHMLPSPARPDNRVQAGEHVSVGAGEGPTYRIPAPSGTTLILVVAAPRKLFTFMRSEEEDARSYLPALRRAIEEANAGDGPEAAVGYLILTLTPS